VVISSIYMPSETDPPSAKMELLYDYCRRKNLPLVVAHDTNSHHPLWGCDSANNRGNRLCEFLATTDLEVVNVGCMLTYCAGNVQSIIDVTFVSRALCREIGHWKVSDVDTMSYHRQIEFSLMSDRLAPTLDFETAVGLIIVLRQHRTRKFGEITQNKGHYAVQVRSRSPVLVPIESSCTTSC